MKKKIVRKSKKADAKSVTLLELVEKNYFTYGNEVIQNRVLSDFRDGLKPVQRRIIWAMSKAGFNSSKNYKKSARAVGDILGKYHPHGDLSIYQAMAKLVHKGQPLIESVSNFGSYEDPPAAMRYTESRLNKFSEEFLLDSDYLAVVPMTPNYDGEYKEPLYLPSKLPYVLMNGNEGVAFACATSIPSFSKESVIALTKKAFKQRVTPQECLDTLEFKYPWGGECNASDEALLSFFESGKGTLQFIPSLKKERRKIRILSHAPGLKFPKVISALQAIPEISKVRDKREEDKIIVDIEYKATKNSTPIIKKIESILTTKPHFQIMSSKRINEEEAKFYYTTIPDLMEEWVKYRITLERKVLMRLRKIERGKLKKQNWLLFALDNREEIIEAWKEKDPVQWLIDYFEIEEDQATFTWRLQLNQLSNLERRKLLSKIKIHKTEIRFLTGELKHLKLRILKQLEV